MIEFDREAVAAIVVDSRDRLLFVHSYRYCVDATTRELPAGAIEEGESILQAAKREVCEETGYETTSPELLYTYWPMNGISDKVFHITRCRAKSRTGNFDTNEVDEVKWFSREEIKGMMASGELKDGFTLVSPLVHFGIPDGSQERWSQSGNQPCGISVRVSLGDEALCRLGPW